MEETEIKIEFIVSEIFSVIHGDGSQKIVGVKLESANMDFDNEDIVTLSKLHISGGKVKITIVE